MNRVLNEASGDTQYYLFNNEEGTALLGCAFFFSEYWIPQIGLFTHWQRTSPNANMRIAGYRRF
jgi:hypothetical protein